ncbi:23S rRNA (pseudouridine(1915)-N(3))-methyltransferase RlmH [Fluviicola sp.]|jgi:23S rRNA (pseudouridine1915-N3)-methyltransferase|uniref:23S rRNA (pseudouridine(1915)-N(3))-methyltransferase RlmH n=1 Tax=Fluviicola sp. TaxID=1917219 RepID=UPI00283266BE|nr:23S rRNA (pseudouridine(1915)-N(3))-methyltransferase RlmH [Fluviicola sp.]MDR0801727.1 23S rRNA (pseudouridine(1915)-N(3))-methyltransferase RlmH [Fluviicola sp.]
MQVTLLCIGKTGKKFLEEGEQVYLKRLCHYISFQMQIIPDIKQAKSLSETQIRQKEGELILEKISASDTLILLDERGKELSSVAFSNYLQEQFNRGGKQLFFVIGGPYGFSDAIYQRANGKISLSRMTFSHQMIRLFFIEQVYRAMTILRNEPYHHQ